MSSTANNNCSVVDDYAVMFDGALYIRKVNKNATPEEKRKRRAQYMKRYRTGRKVVKKKKNIKKEEQGEGGGAQQEASMLELGLFGIRVVE
jgi:hypothetical protein